MNLFVGNLHPESTADGLRTLFSEFGDVVSSKVIFDMNTGASRGFGFVEMADKTQANDAIDNLDVSYFEGNIISVKEAKQNNNKSRGGDNRSGGYRPRFPRSTGSGDYNSRDSYNSNSGYNSNNDDKYNRF